ncbi:unnamed protein product [Sympodiomycopsis kandeliae]
MSVCDIKLQQGASQGSGDASHTHDHAAAASDHDRTHGHSHGGPGGDHGHTHEILDHPGYFARRETTDYSKRNFKERTFTVGLGGPVGSGKSALLLALCRKLRDQLSLAVVTNDIFTREDQEFLIKNAALDDPSRIRAVETGGCPHAAIREDISANLETLEQLQAEFNPDLMFVESGGDNLAASYSYELVEYHIYVS